MAIQGGNAINHQAAYKGMKADGQLGNVVSRLNKGDDNIGYGLGVFSDGADGMKLGESGASANDFVGVVLRELNRAYTMGEDFGAKSKMEGSVLTDGVIWVTAAEDVTLNAPAFVRVGSDNRGNFAATAGSANTEAVALEGVRFLDNATAGSLVKISVHLGA